MQQYHLIYFSEPLSAWKRMQREYDKINTGGYLKGIWGKNGTNCLHDILHCDFQIRRQLNVISIAAHSVLPRDPYLNSLIKFATKFALWFCLDLREKKFPCGGVTCFLLFFVLLPDSLRVTLPQKAPSHLKSCEFTSLHELSSSLKVLK